MNARAAKTIRRLAVKKDPERKIPGLIPALKLAYYTMPRRHPGWRPHREYAPVIWAPKKRKRATPTFKEFSSYGASRAHVRGKPDLARLTKEIQTKEWQKARKRRREK